MNVRYTVKHRLSFLQLVGVAFLSFFWGVTGANAQWHSDSTSNAVVVDTINPQQSVRAISDGDNGAIIVWEDYRTGYDWDIHAQRIDKNGKRVWGTQGVVVCNRPSSAQRYPKICTDGAGGAYVVWEDYRTPSNGMDLYAQHVKSDGTLAYTTKDGEAVATAIRDQIHASICADGSGNAFVAWEDSRASVSTTQPDIYMNKLGSGGVQWGSSGRAMITQTNKQLRPRLCEDGSGGCFLAWENLATVPGSIWATRVSSTGSVLWGYQKQGVNIYKGSQYELISKNVDVRRDGNQFMMAWEIANPTGSSYGFDIMAQRVNMDSTLKWFSPAEVTGNWFADQLSPKVFSDDSLDNSIGNAGLLVVFEDYGRGDYAPTNYQWDISMRRVFANGADVNPTNAFYPVCWQSKGQDNLQAVSLGSGELIVGWQDARAGDSAIYVQRIDRAGKRYFPSAGTASSWGIPLSKAAGREARSLALVPRTDGAIAVWSDNRDTSRKFNVYAQLVLKNGSLPIELSSFELGEKDGAVGLYWSTASEAENAGFEIERRRIDVPGTNRYEVVASYTNNRTLRGAGTSNVERQYSYLDRPGVIGTYEYRIANIDLNGTRHTNDAKTIELHSSIAANSWYVGQNQPNPFHDRTSITVNLPQAAMIDVTVTDILGRVVAMPMNHAAYQVGEHHIAITASSLGLSAGTYFYNVTAFDPTDNTIIYHSDKAKMLQIVR